MEYLVLGKIVNTFGIKGEVKVFNTSTFSDIRYKKNNKIFVFFNEEYKELTIEKSYQKDDKFFIIKFKNYDTIEQVQIFKNCLLFIEKDTSILKQNQYFYSDLEGLLVKNEEFLERGKVIKVNDLTPQISLDIEYENKKYNIPFNDFFIKKIDLEKGEIIVHFIEGLI